MPAAVPFCPFCSAALSKANSTREHVIPRWVQRVPLVADAFTIREGAGKPRTTIEADVIPHTGVLTIWERPLRTKGQHVFYSTVPVCNTCNNGWMAELEDQAKNVLVPLIEGRQDELTRDDMITLSRWATKTAIVFEHDDPTSAQFDRIQVDDVVAGRPARWTTVRVSRWSDPSRPQLRHVPLRVHSDTAEGFRPLTIGGSRTDIAVGKLIIRVEQANYPATPEHMYRIFPDSSRWTLVRPCRADRVRLGPRVLDVETLLSEDEPMRRIRGRSPAFFRPDF